MQDILSYIIEEGINNGAQFVDARYQERIITSLEVKDNKVESATSGVERGLGIRVLVNGVWGHTIVSKMDKEAIRKGLIEAIKAARGSSAFVRTKVELADVPTVSDKISVDVDIDPANISPEEKIALLMEISKGILDFNPSVKSTDINYADIKMYQIYMNSEGTNLEQERIYVWSRIFGSAKENGIFASARHEVGSTKGYGIWKIETPEKIINYIGERLVKQLKAKPPKGGVFPAVLGPEVVGVFTHEAFGHLSEADLVYVGAVTSQKLGQKIASELVTIIDDGTYSGAFGSFPYDDEGVKTQKTILVKDGLLVSLLYDRDYSKRFENMLKQKAPQLLEFFNTKPTGNARAECFRYSPIIRMRNTYIQPRDMSLEELVEEIKDGYYFVAFRGGQANLDGTFQVGIQEAYEIKNGEIEDPVRNVSISGNTLDTLLEVNGVGKDFKLHPGRCGKGQTAYVSDGGPHIRVRKIVVGGVA
ncbi:MAG: metallopeptidase TldD-related protein [Candidatus Njordarchaeales archaeon]